MAIKGVNGKVAIITTIMLMFGIISMWLAYQYADSERGRDELVWQNRISVVLNGRSGAIADWVNKNKQVIDNLSSNQSVQLYYSNLSTDMGLDGPGNQALQEYILPLLHDRALQNGFLLPDSAAQLEIRANVEKPNLAGLALTDLKGDILVSTPSMPTVVEAINAYLSAGANQDILLTGPYFGETGLPTIAFAAPVFGFDEDESDGALGFLIGVRVLDDEFFNLLTQPGEMAETAKNYLVRQQGPIVHFIQNKNSSDVDFQIAINGETNAIIEKDAIANQGSLLVGLNHVGEEVIAAAISVTGTDWTLIRSIDANEALGQIRERKRNILFTAFLIIVSIGILMALLWRHGTSVRLQQAMEKQKELTAKHENLSRFMSVVTNSQPTEISAVDEKGRYTFVNLQAAIAAGSKLEEMIGKKPSAVLGKARAHADELHSHEVFESGERQTHIRSESGRDGKLTTKTDYLPLVLSNLEDVEEKGVLIVKEDITSLEMNRMKRELNLKSLVSTLTMIIASRDPYSAAHSEKVVKVAKVLCQELGVDETTAATVELAGAMMNLGKILVPRELLVKPTNLTSDELSIIRSSMLKSADLISDIEFEGPVCDTLRQIQAHWDGSGQPEGLSGEDILLSARIVAVANAFVAMVSARAHRNGIEMKKAASLLLADADKIFDRRPVVSLMNYLENKGGYEAWDDFGETS